jgi:tRNA dimethylallyltransferase
MANYPIIPLLMGPTASGKSDLAVALAEFFPIEIISVDSALVYRGMDIGTAKPSRAMREQVPHHLIDIRDPAEVYSAAEFCADVQALIPAIIQRGNYPLLVGGTMMYFKALTQGLSSLPKADPEIRAQLSYEAETLGWEALHQRLAEIDSVTAARLHPNDAQRIQRALEIYLITGVPMSVKLQEKNPVFPYAYKSLAIAPADRKILHERIALRFDHMLQHGFIEEVKTLMQRGDLNLDKPALRAVGYRQVWEGLQNHSSLEEIKLRGIAATRQLAKRQLTWLRQWPLIQRYDSTSPDCFTQIKHSIAEIWPS